MIYVPQTQWKYNILIISTWTSLDVGGSTFIGDHFQDAFNILGRNLNFLKQTLYQNFYISSNFGTVFCLSLEYFAKIQMRYGKYIFLLCVDLKCKGLFLMNVFCFWESVKEKADFYKKFQVCSRKYLTQWHLDETLHLMLQKTLERENK